MNACERVSMDALSIYEGLQYLSSCRGMLLTSNVHQIFYQKIRYINHVIFVICSLHGTFCNYAAQA